MKLSRNFVLAVTSSLLAASSLAADGVKVALRLESNGELLGAPVLIAKFGERAAIQTRDDGTNYRIELVAQDAGATVDITLKLYLDEGDGMKLVSEPRIVSQFDTTSSFYVISPNEIRLSAKSCTHASRDLTLPESV